MEKVILARIGEIALKGLNRKNFENKLASNMRKAMKDCGEFEINWSQSRFFITGKNNFDIDKAVDKLTNVFGIVSVSVAVCVDNDMEEIKKAVQHVVGKKLGSESMTFKVEAKRGDKSFHLKSPEICSELGAYILKNFSPSVKVDVNNPDFILFVEVREKTYVYTDIVEGHRGMPVGSNGRGCLLLSGGIDSPVAGYMVAKRGVELVCVHYHSYPYTSERAKGKVIDLAKILASYCGTIKLYIVPFTDIQLEINKRCEQSYSTIIMRRSMMRLAEKIARQTGCMALVTGESIGQVASQTMHSLYCTDNAVNMPVFRPLIGMDKTEVIDIARKIDTYETSILPYEDCCTIFTPRHPKTRPNLDEVIKQEERFDFETLEKEAFDSMELLIVE